MDKISVVIPCRNEESTIEKLIDQIEKQKGIDTKFRCELLIAEGRSTDGTKQIVQNRLKHNKNIILIDNKKQITPIAYNLGVKNAKGKYICLIDAHAEIADDYLLQCIITIKKTGADNVGGPWNGVGRTFAGRAIATAFRSPFSAGGSTCHNVNFEGQVDSVWGGFYKREIFEKIGFFDEELIRNQDEEINYRLKKSGGKIWQSKKIKFKYFVRDSISKLFKQYFQYGYWKVRLMQKHPAFASPRFLAPVLFASSLIVFSLLSFFSTYVFILLIFEVSIYFLANLYFSILSATESSYKYLSILPIIFFVFHFAFGLGTIFGIYSFMIRRKPLKSMSSLSR